LPSFEKTKTIFLKKTLHASQQNRPDVREARETWKTKKAMEDSTRFVFIDESGISTGMTRLYGRGEVGERVFDYVPDTRFESVTILSSLRLDGTTEALMFEGALNGEMFISYMKNCLAPTLKEGDVIIMDNLSSHKVKGLEEVVKERGARIEYLPPYSPDLNPVENMWSKVKTYLRQVKERYKDVLIDAVGAALRTVSTQDAQGWFKHCGYCS
jgi:transposase